MPPETTDRPELRRGAQLLLNTATTTAVALWMSAGGLLLFMPHGRAWMWTGIAAAVALSVAAGAVAFGRKP